MSEAAKSARKAMKDKIARMTKGDPHAKVDASDYSPPDMLDADVKTGARPIRPRLYKKGGAVAVEGEAAQKHAGRKARKSGGRAGNSPATPNNLINRDVREANEEREGKKHVGAFKRGGRTERASGGRLPMRGGVPNMTEDATFSPPPQFRRPAAPAAPQGRMAALMASLGSRKARKSGGMAKHDDAAEDKKLIRAEVKKSALKGHPDGCRCEKCYGGRAGKKGGGGLAAGLTAAGLAAAYQGMNSDKTGDGYDPKTTSKLQQTMDQQQMPYLRNSSTGGGPPSPDGVSGPYKRGGRTKKKGGGALLPVLGGLAAGSVLGNAIYPKQKQADSSVLSDYLSGASAPNPSGTGGTSIPVNGPSGSGLKRGGRAKRATGGSLDGELQGTRPTGGRMARKSGGSAKKGMNVNIIIGAHHPAAGNQQNMPSAPGGPMPHPVPPVALPPGGAMGAGAPPPMGPPPGMPQPPMAGPMPRKSGGRTMSHAEGFGPQNQATKSRGREGFGRENEPVKGAGAQGFGPAGTAGMGHSYKGGSGGAKGRLEKEKEYGDEA